MQLVTGEFVILALLIFFSNQIRKKYSVLESILRGTIVFFPPEKSTGDKTISYVALDDKFSQKSPYFADAELLAVAIYLTLGLTVVSSLLELNPWVTTGTSVSFYMVLMAISLSLYGLYKQCLGSGTTHPDNLLGLLYSLILFFVFSILLTSAHEDVLDFNLHLSAELLELQILAGLKQYLPKEMRISINYFTLSIALALVAALAVYPMFRYLNRFVASYVDCSNPNQKRIYGLIIVFPLFLSTLWVKPMLKNFLPDTPEVQFYFLCTRMSLVMIFCLLKVYYLRTEIQSMLNSTTRLIQDAMSHPSKETLDLCTRKCRATATLAWPVAHQALCCTAYLALLVILLCTKGGLTKPYPTYITETIHIQSSSDGFDDDEFLVKDSQIINIMKNVTYVAEVKRLKDAIQSIVPSEDFGFMESIAGVSKNVLMHPVFYRDTCEFLIWSCLVAWSLGTIMNFVFINISPHKVKTS